MAEYKHKQFIARMNYSSYSRLRSAFKGQRGETVANYFLRLSKYLEELKK